MGNKKKYKYELNLANDVINVRRVYGDTSRRNTEVIRNRRHGIFKPTMNVRVKTISVSEDKKTCCEYGEFIAHLICEKIGIKSCDVDILKRFVTNPRSKSGKGNEVPGAISYIDLQPDEDLVSATSVLSWYRHEHYDEYLKIINPSGKTDKNDYTMSTSSEYYNNNIEVVIPAFMAYVKEKCNGTDKLAEQVKQNIIDMCVFDCRFANRDRHDENYALAVKSSGNGVRFYPLFDNEYILGFSEPTKSIGKYTAASLQEHFSKDLYSVIGVTTKPTKISSAAMLTYLFSNYPKETQKAYEKIMKFTESDLIEIMSECEGLPKEHQAYAARIFRLRGKEIETIQEEFIDKNGKPKEQKYLTR